MNWFKRIFSRHSKNDIDSEGREAMVRALENELAALEMQNAARENPGPSAILTPAVPLPAEDAVGWFGGTARLPKDVAWPEIDGTPLCFVAQIDLAKVPPDIWSGAGPRHGQIALFVHPTELQAKGLHVDGALERRSGPSPVSSEWFRNHHDNRPPASPYFPEWPVRLTSHVGELPEPAGWQKGKAPNFPDPFENETLNLADQAHHPFDEATLEALLEQCDEVLKRTLSLAETFLETKKLKGTVGSELKNFHSEITSSCDLFSEIRGKLEQYCKAFNREGTAPHIKSLGGLPMGSLTYHGDDEEGYANIEVSREKIDRYLVRYLGILYRHARYAYLESPEKLPPQARTRFETIWAFDALHERGGMSHLPKGSIYRPHGPFSPNEILIELPTSDLIGWIWGDMYSVVLTVARDDLAKGKLDNIQVEITN